MSSSGSRALEKSFKLPLPIFTFCDYQTFEEDLTLYLYNFEFPLPNDDLYQV
jgi:hypothetical protein